MARQLCAMCAREMCAALDEYHGDDPTLQHVCASCRPKVLEIRKAGYALHSYPGRTPDAKVSITVEHWGDIITLSPVNYEMPQTLKVRGHEYYEAARRVIKEYYTENNIPDSARCSCFFCRDLDD